MGRFVGLVSILGGLGGGALACSDDDSAPTHTVPNVGSGGHGANGGRNGGTSGRASGGGGRGEGTAGKPSSGGAGARGGSGSGGRAGAGTGPGGDGGDAGHGGVPFDPDCDCDVSEFSFSCTAPLESSGIASVPADCENDQDYVAKATCDDGSTRWEWLVGGENDYEVQIDAAGEVVYRSASGYVSACGLSGRDGGGHVHAGTELGAASCSACLVCTSARGYHPDLPRCDATCGAGGAGAGGEGGCGP